jgi:hypothetical protein
MNNYKIIHAACILNEKERKTDYLFLRKKTESCYTWFYYKNSEEETETLCQQESVSLAIYHGYQFWKLESFRTLNCGFRYTLPARDLVGSNALFHQMAASYNSPNGYYFDPEVGFLCLVEHASMEALDLWRKIRDKENL